jgi:hypothetical protein
VDEVIIINQSRRDGFMILVGVTGDMVGMNRKAGIGKSYELAKK